MIVPLSWSNLTVLYGDYVVEFCTRLICKNSDRLNASKCFKVKRGRTRLDHQDAFFGLKIFKKEENENLL